MICLQRAVFPSFITIKDIFNSGLQYVGVDWVVSKEEDDVVVDIVVEVDVIVVKDDVVSEVVTDVVDEYKVVEDTVVVEGTAVVEIEHKVGFIGFGIHSP